MAPIYTVRLVNKKELIYISFNSFHMPVKLQLKCIVRYFRCVRFHSDEFDSRVFHF